MGALLQANQLHIKYEGCVGRNDARVPLAPISKVRSASQLGTLPDTHLLQGEEVIFAKLNPVGNNEWRLKAVTLLGYQNHNRQLVCTCLLKQKGKFSN